MLLGVVGLVLLMALISYTRDYLAEAEKSDDKCERSGMTHRENSEWKWAENGKIKSAVQCEELEDPDERSGREAYVIFVSAQNANSP